MTQSNDSDIWFCSLCLDFPFDALNNSKRSSHYMQILIDLEKRAQFLVIN